MNNPLISIVMPVYNRGFSYYLKDAIKSIINQTYKNYEFIVINDGSTDNTLNIINSFKDKGLKIINLPKNHGEYYATNYGINIAQGQYLTWIHSDDIMPTNSLELRINFLLDHPEIDFVYGDIQKINEKNEIIEYLDSVDWSKEKILFEYFKKPEKRIKRYIIHHTTIMMKWKFFYKAGPFDCSLPFAGDIDWLIRAIIHGKFKYLPKLLYQYRIHDKARSVIDIKNGIDKDIIRDQITRRYKS